MTKPHVSVVTTVWNGEKTIARCLSSTLREKDVDFEHIVWDDGSTDQTLQIARTFCDKRVKVIEAPRQGRAKSLHDACLSARGRYIAILDADDIALNDRLRIQSAFLDRCPEIGWVGANQELTFQSTGETIVRIYPTEDRSLKRLASKCIPYGHSAVMFRGSFLDKGVNYDPTLNYLIDFDFFIRVAAQTKVASIDQTLARRYWSDSNYFLWTFSKPEKYKFLAHLNKKAIESFNLPGYMLIYPYSRLCYHKTPCFLKPYTKRLIGLREKRKSL